MLLLILTGLFKKMAVADAVAPLVNDSFAWSKVLNWSALYKGACLFTIQIYADLSGYADIARGSSKLLGIDLMENFQQPYLSRNVTQMWRRWHFSLSTWLRDYLYISLGGNRGGRLATYRNNMITRLLGGLWHGASLNYVVWGGLHGVYLAGHKMMLGDRKLVDKPWRPIDLLKLAGTLNMVIAAWIFFGRRRSRTAGNTSSASSRSAAKTGECGSSTRSRTTTRRWSASSRCWCC